MLTQRWGHQGMAYHAPKSKHGHANEAETRAVWACATRRRTVWHKGESHTVMGVRDGQLVCLPSYVPKSRREAFLRAGVGVVHLPVELAA